MDELPNKDQEDAEDSEKIKTPIKKLMKLHFQKNVICYTLVNILYIDEKINKEKNHDVKIKNMKSGNCLNQFHCGIC